MNPKTRIFTLILGLVILTSACQLTSAIGMNTKSTGPARDVFSAPANPINLTLQLAEQKKASAVIPAKGGELSATGADGAVYTLNIPAGALLVDTEISMTPVSAIPELPFSDGLGGAVKFEPDGLFFYQDVFLTIQPAKEIPIDHQIVFGFDGDGKNLGLAMPVVDSKEIRIRLQHFSGAGVGNGVSANKAEILNRLADRAEVRIDNLVSEKLGRERQLKLLGKEESSGIADLPAFLDLYENEVVKPRIKAALAESGTCAGGERAIQTALGLERQRQLLGIANSGGLAKYIDLFKAVGMKCVDEEYKLCAEEHVLNRMIPTWLGISRQFQLLGMVNDQNPETEVEKYARQKTEQCLRFELRFNSEGQFNDDNGKKIYSSRVESRVLLNFDSSNLLKSFANKAPLVNTNFEMVVDNCKVTSRRGGGNFDVLGLGWDYESKNGKDTLKDITLRYWPGPTSENYTVNCEFDTYTSPPGPYWTGIYWVLHFPTEFDMSSASKQGSQGPDLTDPAAPAAPPMPQLPDLGALLQGMDSQGGFIPIMPMPLPAGSSEAGGFLAKNWKIAGGDIIATKDWEMTDPSIGLVEKGQFILFHHPGK